MTSDPINHWYVRETSCFIEVLGVTGAGRNLIFVISQDEMYSIEVGSVGHKAHMLMYDDLSLRETQLSQIIGHFLKTKISLVSFRYNSLIIRYEGKQITFKEPRGKGKRIKAECDFLHEALPVPDIPQDTSMLKPGTYKTLKNEYLLVKKDVNFIVWIHVDPREKQLKVKKVGLDQKIFCNLETVTILDVQAYIKGEFAALYPIGSDISFTAPGTHTIHRITTPGEWLCSIYENERTDFGFNIYIYIDTYGAVLRIHEENQDIVMPIKHLDLTAPEPELAPYCPPPTLSAYSIMNPCIETILSPYEEDKPYEPDESELYLVRTSKKSKKIEYYNGNQVSTGAQLKK